MQPTPNAESIPATAAPWSAPSAPPESARVVLARPPPPRAAVAMDDLPSIMVDAALVVLNAPIEVPLLARPYEALVAATSSARAPTLPSYNEPYASSVDSAPAGSRPVTAGRTVAVALLGIVMGLAVGGSAVAWRTHGAPLRSFTVSR